MCELGPAHRWVTHGLPSINDMQTGEQVVPNMLHHVQQLKKTDAKRKDKNRWKKNKEKKKNKTKSLSGNWVIPCQFY